ncbi:MAG: prepilin-type N-terminal cleavage/methylation domain-containing protein [Burkholderiales bacterium]|nr:prepilin-type N-terminal cleavage/methylation domain-containing protein [Burkholderiales bacterium]
MSPLRHSLATRRGTSGFTLIELVMVLVLLGILAVFVLPRIELTRGFDEVGYRDAVRATLEFARKSAVAERRNVLVTLTGNNLNLIIANDGPEGADALNFDIVTNAAKALPLPVPDRHCSAPIPVNRLCAPPNLTLVSTTADLVFSPLGRPITTLGVSLPVTSYTVTGEAPWTITVEAETGHVH